MAHFAKIQLTQLGKNIILAGQNKQQVVFTKVELGDGLLNPEQSVDDLKGLVHSVTSMPLQKFESKGDGTARLRFVLDNNNLEKGFFNREIGVFAKVGDGIEQLYAYTNAGNLADYIPGKEYPISSKIINLRIIVGNAANLTIVTENSAYVTKLDMDSHKDAAEIDHPDESVTTRKLRDGAVTGAKIAEWAIEKKHLRKGGIVAGDIGAYSKEDVNQLLTDHRTKTLLDHPDGSVLKRHLGFEVYDKGEVYSKNEVETIAEQKASTKVNKSGDTMTGDLTVPSIYVSKTMRTGGNVEVAGNSALYFNDRGGGFYMSDDYWVRSVNNKGIYTGDVMKADGGFQGKATSAGYADNCNHANVADSSTRAGTAANSERLENTSLQEILSRIGGANTGIIAGSLTKNGWVKFANGLIVQWGFSLDRSFGSTRIKLPIAFQNSVLYAACSTIRSSCGGDGWDYAWNVQLTEITFVHDEGNFYWLAFGV